MQFWFCPWHKYHVFVTSLPLREEVIAIYVCDDLYKLYLYLQVQRVKMESHLQSTMRLHLDLACVKLTNTEAKLNETEKKLEETRKVVEKLDTPIFIWKVNDFKFQMDKFKIDSVPFYTDRTESNYGYKLKARIYPNRLSEQVLMVYIVLMKGEYDAIIPWPFKNKLTITVFDQQADLDTRKNITAVLISENNQKVFARPVKEENEQCLCFFVFLKTLRSRRYLVDDTLFLQVEVSPP